MKNIFLAVIAMFSISVFSQEKQYVEIKYEMQVEMELERVMQDVPAQYRAMVEEQMKQELANGIFIDYVLKTNGTESTYQIIEQVNNAQTQGGMIAQQMRSFDKGVTYKNIPENFYMKPVDFPGASYMIKDTLTDLKWNITRENEDIAGFDTRKAVGEFTFNDSIAPVTAWFTPKIAIKDGPSSFWGLPGIILKANFEVNGANMTITAKEINVREEEINIKKPTGGKEVTQKEFEVAMREMQEQFKQMMDEGVDTE